jgi:glycosyltransferase involved in cell wall biosynthesis
MKKITVLIPCYNEEKGLGKVIDDIPVVRLKELGYLTEIIVIDNNSTDRTKRVARSRNVRIIHEGMKGKGNAMRTGFLAVSNDSKFVVMLDGDNTYKGREILRMIEPLESNFCDVVIGSRLSGKMAHGSFKRRNRAANWFYTFLVRQIYRANVTDVLSGYFAWKKDVVVKLLPHIRSRGFAIEMEMITKMVLLGCSIYSVPITYDKREGESKLESVRDGIRILGLLFVNFVWKPDLTKSRREILNSLVKRPLWTLKNSFHLINQYEKNSKNI